MSTWKPPAPQHGAPEPTASNGLLHAALVVLALVIAVPAVLVTQTAASLLVVMQASTLAVGVGASVLLFALSPSP